MRPPGTQTEVRVRQVTIQTSDGWSLAGNLYQPKGMPRANIVLLHQRSGSAQDWESLCLALQKAGYTALAIDQRGAGKSLKGPGPIGNDAPWSTSGDIAAAIESLHAGKTPVGLAGASYGANNALIYSAAHPDQVKAVVLFSPGANYNGLDALTPARAYRGALAIYHAKGDAISGDGPRQIEAQTRSSAHTRHLLEGDGHGTALLTPQVNAEVVRFFGRHLK